MKKDNANAPRKNKPKREQAKSVEGKGSKVVKVKKIVYTAGWHAVWWGAEINAAKG